MSTTTWAIDSSHSSIQFSIRHMLVSKVRGRFERYVGTVHIDDDDMTRSSVDVRVDVASIDTGVADRDAHLRSPDFFDADRFPEIRFRSRRIRKVDDTHYSVMGDLTVRDVTREVTLDVEYGGRVRDPWGTERVGFAAKMAFSRSEFGLFWDEVLEAGGIVLGDRVDIDLDIEGIRPAARRAA